MLNINLSMLKVENSHVIQLVLRIILKNAIKFD